MSKKAGVRIEDEVCARLVNGENLENVSNSYKSGSKLAAGIQLYLKLVKPQVIEIQQTIASNRKENEELQGKIKVIEELSEALNVETKELNDHKSELLSDVQDKESQLKDLRKEITRADADLAKLRSQAEELAGKGFTGEIISKIVASDAADGGEMLSRIQTLEKNEAQVESQNRTLRKLNADLEGAKKELQKLSETSQHLKSEIERQEAALHRKQEEERVFEKMVKECEKVLEEIRKANKESQKLHSDQLKEYGELQTEAAKHGADIERAVALLDLQGSPAALKTIGIDTVKLLLSRFKQWEKMQHWETDPTIRFSDIPMHMGDIELKDLLELALTALQNGELER